LISEVNDSMGVCIREAAEEGDIETSFAGSRISDLGKDSKGE
jgi:hypothetical protein